MTGVYNATSCKILLFIITNPFDLQLRNFCLIIVIDRLEGRNVRVVHFLLRFVRHLNKHYGSGCRLVSNFFFRHNLVDFTRRDMCGTSMKSCIHVLYFVFLHLTALCNLWRCYEPKTEKNADLCRLSRMPRSTVGYILKCSVFCLLLRLNAIPVLFRI